jgi:hypothetical protein
MRSTDKYEEHVAVSMLVISVEFVMHCADGCPNGHAAPRAHVVYHFSELSWCLDSHNPYHPMSGSLFSRLISLVH